ncbi:MBL fold metallo-hydrolase [Cellvibrio sp. ARAG 10.3]|uniref:MBL fold metallo-hydrolase n=1 Tax=Cellvibrio sp. ARAG 10.3 TaxID=3451358 RepID=UPI003F48C621
MKVDTLDTVNVYGCRVSSGRTVNYCWIIANRLTNQAVIVDPAWELATIVDTLHKNGLQLKAVLVTHHHHDHIHLADSVSALYGIPAFISKSERDFYSLSEHQFFTFYDSEILSLAGLAIRPILTPGHTAGSTCFLIGEALFTGDTVFNEGCGMCVGRGASPDQLFASLHRLKEEISDSIKVYPGHRYLTELGADWGTLKKNNIYLNIKDKDTFINFRMRAESIKNAFVFI